MKNLFYKYGVCDELHSRKNKFTGKVQYKCPVSGEWKDFHKEHWEEFEEYNDFTRKDWEELEWI